MRRSVKPAIFVLTASAAQLLAGPAGAFRPIEDPSIDLACTLAAGISADGFVVAGVATRNGHALGRPTRWNFTDGFDSLDDLPPGTISGVASGISPSGGTVVGYWDTDPGHTFPFLWTAAGDVVPLPLDIGTGAQIPLAVTDGGGVAVGQGWVNNRFRAVRWVNAGSIEPVSDRAGAAHAVSASGGRIAGSMRDGVWADDSGPAIWENGEGAYLFRAPFGGGIAFGMNPDGSVIVGGAGSIGSSRRAFKWTDADGLEFLAPPADSNDLTTATGVSDDGLVTVGYRQFYNGTAAGDRHAVVWTPDGSIHGLADLLTALGVDLGGWTLLGCTGVSADGRTVIGSGIDPAGKNRAWIAVLPRADACAGVDLAAPFGRLDFFDLVRFLDALAAHHPDADFASPAGVFDIRDLSGFLDAFTAGCR